MAANSLSSSPTESYFFFFHAQTGISEVIAFNLTLNPNIFLAFLINQSESYEPWQRASLSVVPCLSLV